jgi:SAM-dependent methyltransferase
MTASSPLELSAPSQADTIAAYARLAPEYDDAGHSTTRALERLSAEAFRRAAPLTHARTAQPTLLELGAGTGALTREVLAADGWSQLIATDPAPAMCARLQTLLGARTCVEAHVLDAAGALGAFGARADVVLAGLADPFLTPDTLDAAHASVRTGGVLFVTVPSHNWAAREREGRLGISVDRTRFLLRDGTPLEAASWSYDDPELLELILDAGFRSIGAGTCTAELPLHDARPELAWALAIRA